MYCTRCCQKTMQQWVWIWIPGSASPPSPPRTIPAKQDLQQTWEWSVRATFTACPHPWEMLLVTQTEQLGTQGSTRADRAIVRGMSKDGRNQPQPAPHNQLREGVPQRSSWLLLSPGSRLCGGLLVFLLLPGSPWGLWPWLRCQHTGSDQPAAWIMLSKHGCLQVLLSTPELPASPP